MTALEEANAVKAISSDKYSDLDKSFTSVRVSERRRSLLAVLFVLVGSVSQHAAGKRTRIYCGRKRRLFTITQSFWPYWRFSPPTQLSVSLNANIDAAASTRAHNLGEIQSRAVLKFWHVLTQVLIREFIPTPFQAHTQMTFQSTTGATTYVDCFEQYLATKRRMEKLIPAGARASSHSGALSQLTGQT